MLVDHLGDLVAQENYVGVETLNLPDQLDAVDEINRHWHVLATQGIEKWVLQELAFVAHFATFLREELLVGRSGRMPLLSAQ